MGDDLHPIVRAVAYLTGTASTVWSTWCTVVAFKGGKLPLLPWTMDGGAGEGIVFMVFGVPLVLTVAYWGSLVIMAPFALVFRQKTEHR